MRGVEGGGFCSRVVKGNWNFLCACQFFNHEVHESSLLVERETPCDTHHRWCSIDSHPNQFSLAQLSAFAVYSRSPLLSFLNLGLTVRIQDVHSSHTSKVSMPIDISN